MFLSSFITRSARIIVEVFLWLWLIGALATGAAMGSRAGRGVSHFDYEAGEVIYNPDFAGGVLGALLGIFFGFLAFLVGATLMAAPLLVLFELNQRVKRIEESPEATSS